MNILFKTYKKIEIFKSEIMKLFLKLNGAQIGRNVFISFSARILVKKLVIGNDSQILEHVKIKANSIIIGQNTIISDHVLITGNYNLNIGDKSYIGKKVHIDLSRDVKIGNDVGVGENSVIWTHGYYPPADKGYPVTYKSVEIKNNAWVSTNIIILPGKTIGENVIVGAGSVVTKSVKNDQIIAGNPARIIGEVDSILNKADFIPILLDIFNTNNEFKRINEINKNYYIMNFLNVKIHLIVKSDFKELKLNSIQNDIFIFKDCFNIDDKILKNNLWIDFNSRKAKSSKNYVFQKLLFFLKEFGIRFIYFYS